LAPLDVLLAAVHSRLKLPREEQTQRYLRALDHPRVAILAHPTARRLGMRGGVDADWDAILAKAAERGVAVEANASTSTARCCVAPRNSAAASSSRPTPTACASSTTCVGASTRRAAAGCGART